MRKYHFLLLLMMFVTGALSAQLVNNGGTITIQPNAKLIVESDITNTTGSIINNGTIEVEGDFTNSATVTSGAASKVIFKGATDSNFDSGGSNFAVVENNKTAGDVVLTSALAVDEMVDFSGTSNIDLGAYDVTLAAAATSNGGDATGHFATTAVGNVVKMTDAAGTFKFDVGDGTNYSPIEAVHTGTYTAGTSSITARVDDGEHPDVIADADAKLSRYWTVDNNIASPSIAMTGTYVAADVVGTEADMVGARWENMEWNFVTGAQSGSTISATTTAATSELTGMNFFGKADFKVFLEGPYTSDAMSAGINSSIPTTNPYDATETGVSIPANAVDWVKVELRDAGSNTVTVSTASGLLLTDGTIASGSGNALLLKDATDNSIIGVFHRNSLAVMSQNPLAFATSVPMVNFADGAVLPIGGLTAMQDLTGGKYGLYGGDADGNGVVNSNDLVNEWIGANGQTFNYTTTGKSDFDLNGTINSNDLVNIWIKNNSKSQQIPQ